MNTRALRKKKNIPSEHDHINDAKRYSSVKLVDDTVHGHTRRGQKHSGPESKQCTTSSNDCLSQRFVRNGGRCKGRSRIVLNGDSKKNTQDGHNKVVSSRKDSRGHARATAVKRAKEYTRGKIEVEYMMQRDSRT